MSMTRRTALSLLAASMSGLALTPAWADGTEVAVSLWDKGDTAMDMMGIAKPMGMAMPDADMMMASMGITVNMDIVPAGDVTFKATNNSKGMIHEMVLAPVNDATMPLPYDTENEKVDEDAAGHIGEVAELEPGQSGALTVTLKPGTYILYCNIEGHYIMGMWTLLTVTG